MGIPDTFLHACFVRALSDEYGPIKATLQAMDNRDRAKILPCSARDSPPCPRRRSCSGRPGYPSKRSSRAKAAAGVMRDEVLATVAGAPKVVAAAGAATRAEVASSEELVVAPVAPAIVAAAAAADLLAAVGTRKDSDFIADCARCSCFGHEESTCSSDAAVLAMELAMSEENFTVEARRRSRRRKQASAA